MKPDLQDRRSPSHPRQSSLFRSKAVRPRPPPLPSTASRSFRTPRRQPPPRTHPSIQRHRPRPAFRDLLPRCMGTAEPFRHERTPPDAWRLVSNHIRAHTPRPNPSVARLFPHRHRHTSLLKLRLRPSPPHAQARDRPRDLAPTLQPRHLIPDTHPNTSPPTLQAASPPHRPPAVANARAPTRVTPPYEKTHPPIFMGVVSSSQPLILPAARVRRVALAGRARV